MFPFSIFKAIPVHYMEVLHKAFHINRISSIKKEIKMYTETNDNEYIKCQETLDTRLTI